MGWVIVYYNIAPGGVCTINRVEMVLLHRSRNFAGDAIEKMRAVTTVQHR